MPENKESLELAATVRDYLLDNDFVEVEKEDVEVASYYTYQAKCQISLSVGLNIIVLTATKLDPGNYALYVYHEGQERLENYEVDCFDKEHLDFIFGDLAECGYFEDCEED